MRGGGGGPSYGQRPLPKFSLDVEYLLYMLKVSMKPNEICFLNIGNPKRLERVLEDGESKIQKI